MAGMDEKLNQALQGQLPEPRGASSFMSRHSKRCNSKHSKFSNAAGTPISSNDLSDFDDIDQLLGERMMKAAMKGNPTFKRSGTYHVGAAAAQGIATSQGLFAVSRKVAG